MDVTLELFNSNSPGTTLASRSSTVADAWELEAERASMKTAFDTYLAVHGARLRVRTIFNGGDPAAVTYARMRDPLGA